MTAIYITEVDTEAPLPVLEESAEGPPAAFPGDPEPIDWDARIASALTDDAVRSDAVASLVVEVDAAALAADAVARESPLKALDPLLSKDGVADARRESDNAAFDRDRLAEAAKRLGSRLVELKAIELARAQRAEHEKWQAERDRLAAELARWADPWLNSPR
jgi:hypothetical protein